MCRLRGRRAFWYFGRDIFHSKTFITKNPKSSGVTLPPTCRYTNQNWKCYINNLLTLHRTLDQQLWRHSFQLLNVIEKIGKRKYCKCIYKLKSNNNNKKISSRANLDLFNRPTNYDGFRNICGRSPLTKGKKRAKNERQRKEGGIGKNERKKWMPEESEGRERKKRACDSTCLAYHRHLPTLRASTQQE